MARFFLRAKAILLQRCPKCLHGKVFSGWITMRATCPECGHRFEREPGYFLGAMYASYFLAIPVLLVMTLLIYWLVLPSWSPENVVLVALVPFLFVAPLVYRYSRIIWMHFDAPQ
jgi:uncharacterized protein (DUF983 family)